MINKKYKTVSLLNNIRKIFLENYKTFNNNMINEFNVYFLNYINIIIKLFYNYCKYNYFIISISNL